MREPLPGGALLIPRCSSVHGFGMRFPLDLVLLHEPRLPLRVCRAVRVRSCSGAGAVLALPAAGTASPASSPLGGCRWPARADRVRVVS